jgi:pimeloyl-ACP methyl ester carboxylesterase
MAQIDAIERAVPGARSLRLEGCGHSPHRDRPDAVLDAALGFVRRPVL